TLRQPAKELLIEDDVGFADAREQELREVGEPSGGDDADVPGAPRDHPGEVLAEGEAARGRRLGRDEAVDPDRDEGSHWPRAVQGHDRAEEGVVDWRLPRQRQVEAGAEP